uniref:Amaranthin-like lectin n=1 Tax=Linum usitatissimum TaxID=4006 RepID=A0A097PIB5_LINUS|nr:amaranthin-like lectin [Linum usitatissimum]
MKLPKYVVLKSMYNNKYLSYRDEEAGEDGQDGFIHLSDPDATTLRYSKFEVMESKSNAEKGSVHLKCSFNNKYLARQSPTSWWITASTDHIQEDRSEWSCTLFKPVLVDSDDYYNDDEKSTAVVRFHHVELNHFACVFQSDGSPFSDCLYAGRDSPNLNLFDAFSVIKWESLSQTGNPKRANKKKQVLPKFVVIKSRYNRKYLRYRNEEGEQHGFLQFSLEDDKDAAVANRYAKFEVEKAKSGNGLVHLKCCHNKKYLARSDSTKWWISAGADEVDEDDSKWSCTLFEPVFVDDSTATMVRFRHVQLGRYACLFNSDSSFGECLYAGWKDPNPNLLDVCTIIDWGKVQQEDEDDHGDEDAKPKPVKNQENAKPKPAKNQEDAKPKPGKNQDEDAKPEAETNQEEAKPKPAGNKQEDPKPQPPQKREVNESDQVEFTAISSQDTFWGAVFASTKILPNALPKRYKPIHIMRGDGFSQGSIREISFIQGDVEKLQEKIAYVDHENKTITWSLIQGGMLTHYDTFKITISVYPKKRRDRGCSVNWSYVGTNPKPGFDKDALMKLFTETLKTVDDYLETNAARD